MRQEGLCRIEYTPGSGLAVLTYQPGAHYVLDDIMAYVQDMSDDKAGAIIVYEGEQKMHELVRTPGKVWVFICTAPMM